MHRWWKKPSVVFLPVLILIVLVMSGCGAEAPKEERKGGPDKPVTSPPPMSESAEAPMPAPMPAPAPAPEQAPRDLAMETGVELPMFPCKPPEPSEEADLTPYLKPAGSAATLGEVSEKLAKAMDSAGYVSRSYLPLECDPAGFVVVARMERFNQDGTPLEGDGRWACEWDPYNGRGFSLKNYLCALFSAAPGHYRVLVFVISRNGVTPDPDVDASEEQALLWLKQGVKFLPAWIARLPMTAEHNAEVLIYQFTKSSSDERFDKQSHLPGDIHLQRSGLARYLGEG